MPKEITNLKLQMKEIQVDIKYIKQGLVKNDEQHKEIISKIDGFIQSAEDRFADKADHKESMKQVDCIITTLDDKYAPIITYKIMVWAGGLIGGAIILGVLALIAKTYLYIN